MTGTEITIQVLTCSALAGLLGAVGLRLTWREITTALKVISGAGALQFNLLSSLTNLATTITLPLVTGVFARYRAPDFARALLRPVEVTSEALGAVSFVFVTATQFRSIMNLGWRAWLAIILVSEISLLLGWKVGGSDRAARRVVALGTSNRNIALALLMAIQSFHWMEIAAAVVGYGILLIGLGLLHVTWWRFEDAQRSRA